LIKINVFFANGTRHFFFGTNFLMCILLLLLGVYFAPLAENLLEGAVCLVLSKPLSQDPVATPKVGTFVVFPVALGFQVGYNVLELPLPEAPVQRVAAGHRLLSQKVF
jgi:hypothetical protein